ncbi:hypothetical protein [Deinococcus peraridilitoris]|uniref:Uncharacterized protein n=1 Tax=Deinococcus peraridilitoris (strain DSM 19664 / LMG 22246 / CIP 109416 / KR-200) TaxID=937777 RepID=K9ZZP0_DEIPD|nr:hypothetical protein [Deinococcus peraridilitoris]AFZ67071.1 hypothetical protein Deipe_1530 [Deinococcus peraridilitoris DSM 19664]
MPQDVIPAVLPVDNTPRVYSNRLMQTYLLRRLETLQFVTSTLTAAAAVAAGAVTASLTAAPNVTVYPGDRLDFNGVVLVVAGAYPVALTAAATNVPIVAAPAPVALNAAATYDSYLTVPNAEESNPAITDDEETITVMGRATPIRVVNGKDLTATITMVAGLDDPIVLRLTELGTQLSPGNRARLIFRYTDGFALLATVNIGAPSKGGGAGSLRSTFSANLSGKLYWTNLNDANPQWREVGALAGA